MDESIATQIRGRKRAGSLFGDLLRHWRKQRRVSQLDLALAAGTSQRHVSFLELGKSRPSRGMVLALAERLDIPLRARNEILIAAGHAPFYPERPLTSEALTPTVNILKRVLEHHEPYPAFVIDGGWNILMINRAAANLVAPFEDGIDHEGPVGANLLRSMCDPKRLRPFITSWARTGSAILARLRRDATAYPGAPAELLLRDLLAEGAFPRYGVIEEPDRLSRLSCWSASDGFDW
jgi:transcriptional regulator with XRE-family HTH domain